MKKQSTAESVEAHEPTVVIDGDTLPSNWVRVTVDDICEIASGQTPKGVDARSEPGGDIAWYRVGDMNTTGNEIYLQHAEVTLSNDSVNDLKLHIRPVGTIVFPKRGGAIATNKKRRLSKPAAYDLNIMGLILDSSISSYFWWWFQSIDLGSLGTGSSVPQINNGDIAPLKIPLPPAAEQTRIVSKIESLQARSTKTRALLAEVKPLITQLRQSLLRSAFNGSLTADWREKQHEVETNGSTQGDGAKHETASELLQRIRVERRERWEAAQLAAFEAKGKEPSKGWRGKYKEPEPVDETGLPELPSRWCWASWGEISDWITYGFTRPMPHVKNGPKIITAKNINHSRIDFENVHHTPIEKFNSLSDKDRPIAGDILITKDGTIGRAAVVLEQSEDFCINQSVAVVMLRGCPISRQLLLRAIEAPFTQNTVQEQARGMAMRHLSITDFAKMPLPLPSKIEQDVLVDKLEDSLESIDRLQKLIASMEKDLTQLDKSILSKAFRGELVSQNSNDEPASKLLARIRATREATVAKKKPSKKDSSKKESKTKASGA